MPGNDKCVKCASRLSWIGIWDSAFLALFKGVIGILTGSRALTASALYSLHDVISGVAVLIGLKIATRPADKKYPYGYGNAEYIVCVFTSILILGATVFLLGDCIRTALDVIQNIRRFGYANIPMDCSQSRVCVDIANRPYSRIDLKLRNERVEDVLNEDITHFFSSFAQSLGACIHVVTEFGENDHHKTEAAFKALAVSLRSALTLDPRRELIPSSKGVL